jgi:cell wall-associated NlpC family hydrolase
MSRQTRPIGALVLVFAATLSLGVAAGPASADDYPTWAEVQAAKHNEAAKQAEVAKIEALVNGLETEAALAAKAALEANEAYNIALDALEAAEKEADNLQRRADRAQRAADKSSAEAGTLITQLARTGSGDFTMQLLLADERSADDLLYKMGAMSKLSEQSARIYEQALLDANLAESLSKKAAAARDARAQLADEAEVALQEAEQASAEAEIRAQNQEAVAAELYAQLASLKGTTAATEQAYLDGLAWEAAQAAVTNPPPPPPPVNPTPPAPNTDAVGGAIGFAQAQVGDPYQLNGSGPDAWDCSGLTKASYASVGVFIGTHSATNQYATMQSAGRLVPFNDLLPGDLLFYSNGGSASGSKYHVTLYIGNGLMIEAPYPGLNVRVAAIRYGDLVPYAGRPTP